MILFVETLWFCFLFVESVAQYSHTSFIWPPQRADIPTWMLLQINMSYISSFYKLLTGKIQLLLLAQEAPLFPEL